MKSGDSFTNESSYDHDLPTSPSWQHDDGRASYETRRQNKRVRRRLIHNSVQNLPLRILFATIQLILACFTMLMIWSSWTLLYQRDIVRPVWNPVYGTEWNMPQHHQSLAASSEFLSTMIQTVIFHFPDRHMMTLINELLLDLAKNSNFIQRRLLIHFEELRLKPEKSEPNVRERALQEPVYQKLTPFTFIPKSVNISTGEFQVSALGEMEHANAVATIASTRFELSNISADMTLTCKFPTGTQTMENFSMRFDRITKAVQNPSRRITLLLSLLNRLFQWVDTSFEPIPIMPSELERLERWESFLSDEQLKRFQQGYYEPLVSTDKRSPKAKYLDTIMQLEADQRRSSKGSDLVPIAYRRNRSGIKVPSALTLLTLEELKQHQDMWRALWKGALHTFVLNKKMQNLLTATITDICKSWLSSLSIELEVYTFGLGIERAEDGPFITMSADQPTNPFTYAISCLWKVPNSRLSFGLKGWNNSSLLKIDISDLKLAFNATVHVPHPMLTDRSFLTFSFVHDPVVDFSLEVDTNDSHIFHANLSILDPFVRFTSDYALKPFLLKWFERFLQTITSPGKFHIPWFDKPTEFIFSRIEADSWFASLRSKISTFL